jgi:hypothetical protein
MTYRSRHNIDTDQLTDEERVLRVPMMMCDTSNNTGRGYLNDGTDNPYGLNKPGFRYVNVPQSSADTAIRDANTVIRALTPQNNRQAIIDAYEEYDRIAENAWKKGTIHDEQSADAQQQSLSFATPVGDASWRKPVPRQSGDSYTQPMQSAVGVIKPVPSIDPTPHGTGASASQRGQREGDTCTLNGRTGVLKMVGGKLVCRIDNNRDAASDNQSVEDAIREHQSRMAILYDQLDRESEEKWRNTQ